MDNIESTQNATFDTKVQLINSTGVLVMGILSLVCFCCIPFGLASLVLGILAIVLGNKAIAVYYKNPEKYTAESLKNVKAGKTCGIIGICLGGLWFVGLLIKLSFVTMILTTIFSAIPWNGIMQ